MIGQMMEDWTDELQGIINEWAKCHKKPSGQFHEQSGRLVPLPNFPFFTLTFSLCFGPRGAVHLSLPSLLIDCTPYYLNTILLCELVFVMFMAITVLLKCSQCSELNFNPAPSQ